MNNKTALITGASRGIGAATATLLAKQGANLVLAARNVKQMEALAKQLDPAGKRVIAVKCDVSRYEDVFVAVDTAIKHFGQLDILINNAGTIEPISLLHESEPSQWDQVIDINTKGVYYGIHAALKHMLPRKQGTIINVSSGAAVNALAGWSHYCASKAAVLALTKCTDKEYRDSGITSIGMSPGTVATDMQVAIKESGINAVSQLTDDDHIPAEWAAKAIAYLCTNDAKEFRGTDFSLRVEENRRSAGLI